MHRLLLTMVFPIYGTFFMFKGQTIAYEFVDAGRTQRPFFDVADGCESPLQVRACHIRLFFGRRGVEYQASPASGILSQYISATAMPIDRLAKTDGTHHHLGRDEVLTGNCSKTSISWGKLCNDSRKEKAEDVAQKESC